MIDPKVSAKLIEGFANFGWGHLLMILVGGALIYLAIVKEYEPVLLLPIGMRSADPRVDDAGTFIGSSFVYATAQDWARFGLLYLRGSVPGHPNALVRVRTAVAPK